MNKQRLLIFAGIIAAVACVVVVFTVVVPMLEKQPDSEDDFLIPEITQAMEAEDSEETAIPLTSAMKEMETESTVTPEETKAEEISETTMQKTGSEEPKPHEDRSWGEKAYAKHAVAFVDEHTEQREDPALLEKQKAGLQDISVGGSVLFGVYEQDDDTKNGPEEIEWLVLDKDENGRYLLLSKLVLDMKPYYAEYSPIATWEGSTVRSWLNSSFLNEAFPVSEQALIPEVLVENTGNAKYGTYGGNNTQDRCFLLSAEEGYLYLPTDEARMAGFTEKVNRLKNYIRERGNDTTAWLVRTPGPYTNMATAFAYDGEGPYVEDYTFEEIIEKIEKDESLSEMQKQEEIEAVKNGTMHIHRGGRATGAPQFLAVGIRPALWVDISGLR